MSIVAVNMVIILVSGNGVIEKRETQQSQIYQYQINIGKRVQLDFELPANIGAFQSGQKVAVSITTSKPKKSQATLILRGEVYQIEKAKTGTRYIVFFSGLLGSIVVRRKISGIRVRKPIYVSIST